MSGAGLPEVTRSFLKMTKVASQESLSLKASVGRISECVSGAGKCGARCDLGRRIVPSGGGESGGRACHRRVM